MGPAEWDADEFCCLPRAPEQGTEKPGADGGSGAFGVSLQAGKAVLGGAACVFLMLPPGISAPGAVQWFLLLKSEKCNWTSSVCSYPRADKLSTRKSQVSNHHFS